MDLAELEMPEGRPSEKTAIVRQGLDRAQKQAGLLHRKTYFCKNYFRIAKSRLPKTVKCLKLICNQFPGSFVATREFCTVPFVHHRCV
jgi:hypothetical protein